MDATAILQRTNLGLETIKTKSVRLTQSERLILIMVNGVTPYTVLREKVWALSTERFTRALGTLLAKDLIFEVLLPDAAQQADELDSSVVEEFLRQDTLDPVTIISADPEDNFGMDLIAEMGHAPSLPASDQATTVQMTPARASGAKAVAPPALSPDPSQAKALPASCPELAPGAARDADAVPPSREINQASRDQALPAAVRNPAAKPAASSSARPDHARTGSSAAPRGTGTSEAPRKPDPRPPIRDRRDAMRDEASFHPAQGKKKPHDPRRNQRTSAQRDWVVDVLKLCSWTGVISGFGIFMFLLFQYYYRSLA